MSIYIKKSFAEYVFAIGTWATNTAISFSFKYLFITLPFFYMNRCTANINEIKTAKIANVETKTEANWTTS